MVHIVLWTLAGALLIKNQNGKVLSGLLGWPGRTPEDLPHGPHADAEDKGSEGPIDPRNPQQESYKCDSRYKRPEKAGGKGFLPPP